MRTLKDLREFPAESNRVESGPIQFGNDWPGIFIRGDNAIAFKMDLFAAAHFLPEGSFYRKKIEGWIRFIEKCDLRDEPSITLNKLRDG